MATTTENVRVLVTTHGAGTVGRLAKKFTSLNTELGFLMRYLGPLAIAYGFYRVATAASEFERKVADIYTLMNKADPMFGKFEAGLRKVKLAVPLAELNDLTAATYKYISATGDTAHAMEVVEKVSRTAIGNQAMSAEVMNVLNKSYANFGFTAEDTDKILDMFSETISEADAMGSDLAQQFGRMAAASSFMGMKLEETLAVFAVGSRALNVEEVATGWTAMGATIARSKEKFDELGISTTNLVDMLTDLKELQLTETEMMELFQTQRTVRLIEPLINNLEEVKRVQKEIGDASGVMGKKFDTVMETSAGKAATLLTVMGDLKLIVGFTLVDAFGNVYTAIDDAGKVSDELNKKLGRQETEIEAVVKATAKWAAGFLWVPGMVAKLDEMTGFLGNALEVTRDLTRGTIGWGKALDTTWQSFKAMVKGEIYKEEVFGVEPKPTGPSAKEAAERLRRAREGIEPWQLTGPPPEWIESLRTQAQANKDIDDTLDGQAETKKELTDLERDLAELTGQRVRVQETFLDRLRDEVGTRKGRQGADLFMPDPSAWGKFYDSFKDGSQKAMAGGIKAAITGGDVKGAFINFFAGTFASGVMSLLGKLGGDKGLLGLGGLFGFLQHGGLVTKPTLAMVGEAGPELVMPVPDVMALLNAAGARATAGYRYGASDVVGGGGAAAPAGASSPTFVVNVDSILSPMTKVTISEIAEEGGRIRDNLNAD